MSAPRAVVPEELWDAACTFASMFWRAVALGQEMERESAQAAAEAEATGTPAAADDQALPMTSVTEAAA